MSKISRDKKKDIAKGKKPAGRPNENGEPTEMPKSKVLNYGKCITCRFRNHDKVCVGKTSPKNGEHVARKLEACDCYKCKVN